jgi:hypothetical protein
MLYEEIIQLKKDVRTYGMSWSLDYIKSFFVEKLELEATTKSCDPVFKKTLSKMRNLIEKIKNQIDDQESLLELKNIYSETYMYTKLKSLLFIEGISESLIPTPDFKITFQGSPIYVEVKSLNMVDGILKHQEIMKTALDNNIEREVKMRTGQGYASSAQIVQPYRSSGKVYNRTSQKMIIETLIKKISGNIKESQYRHGDTILLIDLSDQLPVPDPDLQIRSEFEILGQKVSGALWYAAFGQPNDEIYKLADSERDNYIEILEKEGILYSYPYVKGLIFHTDENFYSLARSGEKNVNIISLMEYLSPKTFSLLSLLSTLPDIPDDFADMD